MKRLFILIFGSLLLFLNGCTTEPIQPYQPTSSSLSERTVEESGVAVALDPFIESGRTKQYFNIDAVADGIAILHVRVTNKTADQTFLVEKKGFQLLPAGTTGGLTGDGKNIERPQTGTATLAGVGVLFALNGVAGIGSAMTMLVGESKSTEIQRNATSKEMGDATLSPGKSMEGFIYFTPVKQGADWTRTAIVKINLTETRTQKVIEFNVPLSH